MQGSGRLKEKASLLLIGPIWLACKLVEGAFANSRGFEAMVWLIGLAVIGWLTVGHWSRTSVLIGLPAAAVWTVWMWKNKI